MKKSIFYVKLYLPLALISALVFALIASLGIAPYVIASGALK